MLYRKTNFKIKKELLLLLVVAAILRLYFVYQTPLYWNGEMTGLQAFNDEEAHINYVKYIMRFNKLPVQNQSVTDENAFKTFAYEYYQPPLSYHWAAYTAKLLRLDPFGPKIFYTARIITFIFGLLCVYLIYIFTNRNFERNEALLLSWFYALSPVSIRHTSAFSNDALLWVFMLLLFISITTGKNGSRFFGVIEGFILGAALFTKSSALVMVGFYIFMAITDREHYQRWLLPVFIGLLFSSSYFIRNYSLYGEFIGIDMSHGIVKESLSNLQPQTWFKFLRSLVISASFPFDTISIPFWLKLPVYLVWGAIIFGSFLLSVFMLSKNYLKNPNGYLPELIWALAFLAMVVYNWKVLMVEFRVIYFAFPAMLFVIKDYLVWKNYRITAVIYFFALIYPLILVYAFG